MKTPIAEIYKSGAIIGFTIGREGTLHPTREEVERLRDYGYYLDPCHLNRCEHGTEKVYSWSNWVALPQEYCKICNEVMRESVYTWNREDKYFFP